MEKKIRNIDSIKYFDESQIRLLRRTVRDKAELALSRGNVTAIREWMLIDLLTSTGLRVSEAANLRCGDLKIGNGDSRLFVRYGKGAKSAHILIPKSLKCHAKRFLRWKEQHGEPTGEDDHVFIGQRGPITMQAIQFTVRKWLKSFGWWEPGKNVHALRHSYGVALYGKKKDLRCVQKQLRHTSILSTQIYADVTEKDIQKQVDELW